MERLAHISLLQCSTCFLPVSLCPPPFSSCSALKNRKQKYTSDLSSYFVPGLAAGCYFTFVQIIFLGGLVECGETHAFLSSVLKGIMLPFCLLLRLLIHPSQVSILITRLLSLLPLAKVPIAGIL
jgi:hypothetical protein